MENSELLRFGSASTVFAASHLFGHAVHSTMPAVLSTVTRTVTSGFVCGVSLPINVGVGLALGARDIYQGRKTVQEVGVQTACTVAVPALVFAYFTPVGVGGFVLFATSQAGYYGGKKLYDWCSTAKQPELREPQNEPVAQEEREENPEPQVDLEEPQQPEEPHSPLVNFITRTLTTRRLLRFAGAFAWALSQEETVRMYFIRMVVQREDYQILLLVVMVLFLLEDPTRTQEDPTRTEEH